MTATALLDSPVLEKYRQFRFFKDKATSVSVTIGGLSVVGTLLLIFCYLIYEVMPLFSSIEVEQKTSYPLAQSGKTVYLAMEEQAEVAFRLTHEGQAVFWHTHTGNIVETFNLPLPANATITSFAESAADSRQFIVGLSNGQVIIAKHNYVISYPDDKRVITPTIEYPEGTAAIDIASRAILHIAYRSNEEAFTIAAVTDDSQLHISRFTREDDFMAETVALQRQDLDTNIAYNTITHVEIDIDQRWLFFIDSLKKLNVVDISNDSPSVVDSHQLETGQTQFTDMTMLLGGISVLTADNVGRIVQWFMVRDDAGDYVLQSIRTFSHPKAAAVELLVEHRRKGFLAYNDQGDLAIYHSTAHRELLSRNITSSSRAHMALSPRADALIVVEDDNNVTYWSVENEHPDTSWSSLWQQVWYESYPEPDYIWQSSSSSNDFEPKFSLAPLAFGTLKAALYTMVFAAPLAICGAIYTAYFMTPAMRRKVKPLIELMEALPTVILGFLAGIWLAPFVENHLPSVFALFVATPVVIFLASLFWFMLAPRSLRAQVRGSEAALLVPVILLSSWACIEFNWLLEKFFFAGDMRAWITQDLGISFDQRNALVVGIAMGLAVIPTIFSITEDAIFSVPKHLSNGSLALGASPWQTLVGVILPTASPGIFSALMIGMGRAVGETMIVLMATGNTPIMDANIFEGMRTLSANIAVEIPEAEVDSTHFRILYLSAFFLFLFTFMVNTIAEIVRQRLRKRYGTL